MPDVLIVLGPPPIKKSDLAALGFGRTAAEHLGGACDVLLLGAGAEALDAAAAEVARLGPRVVRTFLHADLEPYTAEAQASALAAFLLKHPYRLIGTSTSSASREYLPRVAALIEAPMASDVLAIEALEADRATFRRAVFVGNLIESVELSGPLVLATCRPSEFEVPEAGDATAAIEPFAFQESLAHPGKRQLSLTHAESERPDLKEADIVISVGRGTRGPEEGIRLAEELADLLGAAVGATRAVVDAGWLPNEFQVGQTGKIVAPKLYIAVGLSGSIQHLAGMRNSKTIVAINNDPEAPIFEVADFGLVADLFEALPEMAEAIRKLR